MVPIIGEREPHPETLLTISQFEDTWGGQIDLTHEQFVEIWQDTEQLYDNLPYHNFLHAREVLFATMELADECEANDIPVSRKVLIASSLFHDALFTEDPKNYGYTTKEELSAALFEEYAPKYGFTEAEIETGKQAIIATTAGEVIEGLYSIILVRADLENIAGDYLEDFIYKSSLLRQEVIQLTGKDMPWRNFVAVSMQKLSLYLSNDLNLPFEESANRQNIFKSRAVENIKRQVLETAELEGLKVRQFLESQQIGRQVLKVLGYKNAA
jgi:hypothetical protein